MYVYYFVALLAFWLPWAIIAASFLMTGQPDLRGTPLGLLVSIGLFAGNVGLLWMLRKK